MDQYGFQKHGLVSTIDNPGELSQCLQNIHHRKPDARLKARFYCDTIGTSFDGQSTVLVRDLIHQIIENSPIDDTLWGQIPGIDLTTFRLRENILNGA